MTCLNMGGLSVTLMPIKEEWWLEALEAPTLAPSWSIVNIIDSLQPLTR